MKSLQNLTLKTVFLSLFVFVSSLGAIEPTQDEMQMKQNWVGAKFDGKTVEKQLPKLGIQVIQNYEFVRQNYGYGGKIKIKDTVYESGIMAHAYSKLRILLPQGGVKFSAMIGIDNNRDIGLGEVQFFVKDSKEQTLFQSDPIVGNIAPVPVDVKLDGASEFFLEVDSLGANSSDQAVWADAKIELADGSSVLLGDMDVISNNVSQTYDCDYPFSFVYNGKSSREFLKDWKLEKTSQTLDQDKVLKTLVFSEPDGPLQVTCLVTEYQDFPTVEWVLKFKNTSENDTPIIENIQAVDTIFGFDSNRKFDEKEWGTFWGLSTQKSTANKFILHHSIGSPCRPDDYMPHQAIFEVGMEKKIATERGRGTSSDLPYFDIQTNQMGWIVVLGWPGQWSSLFKQVGPDSLQVTAGQELTHFKLLPGEEVRSPLAVVQAWKRDSWYDGQNIWRAWMIEHNVPRDTFTNEIVDHHISGCSSHWFAEMGNADEKSQIEFIDRYLEEKIPLDYWWMDAGWYFCGGNWPETGGSWPSTGTWEVDTNRFPKGFRPITDHNRENGIKTIVWFEPERVAPNTWLTTEHPDWIIGGANGGLLNLSRPEVVDWMIEHFDAFLKKEGIELYRQDFNIDPLDYWRKNDAEDRQGITEIKYIEGYLRYWDALLERNPGLRIDSCASGGRRNDLETMRRAVPLWRTDYILNACANQSHTYGISLWIPFHGSGFRSLDDYGMRSAFAPYCNFLYDLRDKSLDYDTIRKNVKIWHDVVAPYYRTDYYPLTPATTDNDQWLGWQFNRPEDGTGIVQMFRRPESQLFVEGIFQLKGLDPAAEYEFQDIDTGKVEKFSGKSLMEDGFGIKILEAPAAVIYTYKKVSK